MIQYLMKFVLMTGLKGVMNISCPHKRKELNLILT